MVPVFSDALIEWAARAGMEYSTFQSSGAACFANGGGEYRYYVRLSALDDGWYVVTRASRNGEEHPLFLASEMASVEKYFWGIFGADMRSVQRLPRLAFPTEAADTASGYSISRAENGQVTLVDAAEKPVVRTQGDDVTDISLLVKMSFWIGYPISDLKAAFQDPHGRPIFPIRAEERR